MAHNINSFSKSAFSPYTKPPTEEKKSSTTQTKVENALEDYKAVMRVNSGIAIIKKDFNAAFQIFERSASYIERHRTVTATVNTLLGDEFKRKGHYLNSVECYLAAIIAQDDAQIRNNLRTEIGEILKIPKVINQDQYLPKLLEFAKVMIKKDIETAMVIFNACAPHIKDKGTIAEISELLADEFSLKKANTESLALYSTAMKYQDNQQIQINLLMKMRGLLQGFNRNDEGMKLFKSACDMQMKLCAAQPHHT